MNNFYVFILSLLILTVYCQPSSIALYNLQGKQMNRLPGSAERIKMPATSGIYFLQFVFDQSVVNKRIVVKAP